MTPDLVTWLTSALDEIERAAESASHWREPEQWTIATDIGDRHNYPVVVAGGLPGDGFADPLTDIVARGDWIDEGEGRVPHIALHDPRSALARVESDRAVLRLHSDPYPELRDPGESTTGCGCGGCEESIPCPTIRLLAYGHRHTVPGWRAEWAPEGVSADA